MLAFRAAQQTPGRARGQRPPGVRAARRRPAQPAQAKRLVPRTSNPTSSHTCAVNSATSLHVDALKSRGELMKSSARGQAADTPRSTPSSARSPSSAASGSTLVSCRSDQSRNRHACLRLVERFLQSELDRRDTGPSPRGLVKDGGNLTGLVKEKVGATERVAPGLTLIDVPTRL